MFKSVTFSSLLLSIVYSQDPAQGWLGYAKGTSPSSGTTPITYIEATWTNLQNPTESGCFYSPWFGIETSDNLNLFQPVNPWDGRSEWTIYNEYFQWKPTHNENSQSHRVYPGDTIYGNVTFDESKQEYTAYHADLTKGHEWSVTTTIPVQKDSRGNYKVYTITYFVFEKTCSRCAQYPPDNNVTFSNIKVEWGGKQESPKWETAYVDNVCDNRAKIVDESTVQITWNSQRETINDDERPSYPKEKKWKHPRPRIADMTEHWQNKPKSFAERKRWHP